VKRIAENVMLMAVLVGCFMTCSYANKARVMAKKQSYIYNNEFSGDGGIELDYMPEEVVNKLKH